MPDALVQGFGGGGKINDEPTIAETTPAFRIENRTTTCCEDDAAFAGQALNDFRFAAPEARFSLDFENGRDVDAGQSADFMVAIEEARLEPPREQTADGRLARPHQADEKH